jgi:predicted nuclease of restriction endonuclease-like (RecB) superfamily
MAARKAKTTRRVASKPSGEAPSKGRRARNPRSPNSPEEAIRPQAVAKLDPPSSLLLPPGYGELLEDLKDRIQRSRLRAALSANGELIRLYWEIGRAIAIRQEREGWGSKIVDRLAGDLQKAFPGKAGFSRTNVHRVRAFYLAYSQELTIVPPAVGQLSDPSSPILAEADGVHLPQLMAEIPWSHNLVLLEKLKDPNQRVWYARKTLQHGWSRAVLIHQIERDLFAREGQAINNFPQTLPALQSDLAQQTLKDPYVFDFLDLAEQARERELQRGLLEHLRDFMVELGVGFAFVGSQHHLEVEGQDYYLDLLFYHLRLRAFVVIDLKVEEFKPEFAGKMNFYLSALDDRYRHQHDEPSIGIILCKARNEITVEYALRDSRKPIGVSEYRLTKALPKELEAALPTVKQLQEELETLRPEGDEP